MCTDGQLDQHLIHKIMQKISRDGKPRRLWNGKKERQAAILFSNQTRYIREFERARDVRCGVLTAAGVSANFSTVGNISICFCYTLIKKIPEIIFSDEI